MANLTTIVKRCCAALLLLALVGCSEESLYSGLSEQEANEMVAELYRAGLSATKQPLKGNLFGVSTSPDEFAQAVGLLTSLGLPKKRYDTLGEVFEKEGFVSSPLEERARLNYAFSQELSSTLSSIDGVVLARVHLVLPAKNDLDDTTAAASASVLINHRAGVNLTGSVSKIKALVVNGIENLPYENVTVALFELESQSESQAANVVAMPNSFTELSAKQMSLLPESLIKSGAGIAALLGMMVVLVLAGIRFWRSRQSS